MMKRMMDNICSNIQKYARKEQPIYLQISIEKGNLKIVFENEKKEINHEVESNKIGLKSVKKIIEIHQGQCFIQDLMDSFILILHFHVIYKKDFKYYAYNIRNLFLYSSISGLIIFICFMILRI